MSDAPTGAHLGGASDNSGVYAIAVAVLLGAVLVSAAVYFGIGGLGDLISKAPVNTLTANALTGNTNTGAANTGGNAGTGAANTGGNVATLPRTHGADKTTSVTVGGTTFTRPYVGPDNAKVTILEFSDFQCPFCQRAYPTVEQFMKYYDGKVKLVFMQFPLTSIHPYAEKAAEAAECAADQGAFWDYHDQNFEAKTLTVDDLKARAKGLGLDTTKFNACLDGGAKAASVAAMENAGANAGVQGTPAFIINGELISGALPFDDYSDGSGQSQPGFKSLIGTALTKAG